MLRPFFILLLCISCAAAGKKTEQFEINHVYIEILDDDFDLEGILEADDTLLEDTGLLEAED